LDRPSDLGEVVHRLHRERPAVAGAAV